MRREQKKSVSLINPNKLKLSDNRASTKDPLINNSKRSSFLQLKDRKLSEADKKSKEISTISQKNQSKMSTPSKEKETLALVRRRHHASSIFSQEANSLKNQVKSSFQNKGGLKRVEQKREEQKSRINNFVFQLQKRLSEHFFINQKSLMVYLIKSQNLFLLNTFLVDILTSDDSKEILQEYSQLSYLSGILPLLDQIRGKITVEKGQQPDYEEEERKFNDLLKRRERAKSEIDEFKAKKEQLNKIEEELEKKEKKVQRLEGRIEELKKTKESFKASVETLLNTSQISDHIKRKLNNYNFKKQNSQKYEKKCEEYLKNQRDMFQYATFLNNNKLAVSLDYNSAKAEEQYKALLQKMSSIFSILDQKQNLEKHTMRIRYFIQDLLIFFQERNDELERQCHLKTHCIRSFIRNVKLWLKNWEFKQDVLTNLKKLFVVTSVKTRAEIDKLKKQLPPGEEGQPMDKSRLNISNYFEEMVQYFKIGNSFY